MLTPHTIDKSSPLLGEECAYCKDPFAPGDEIIICPEDGSRHHVRCWVGNNNQCAAYGCAGRGDISQPTTGDTPSPPPVPLTPPPPNNEPPRWANTCLVLSTAITMLLCGASCFGLWLILDYLMLNVWNYPYR